MFVITKDLQKKYDQKEYTEYDGAWGYLCEGNRFKPTRLNKPNLKTDF